MTAPLELPVLHLFSHFRSLGGVQSMLQRHLAQDARFGLRSRVLAAFDPFSADEHGVRGLGLTWRSSIRRARRRFLELPSPASGTVAVYHNGWATGLFCDLDQAHRRVAVLHSDLPGMEATLAAHRGLLDGVLCVSEPLLEAARAAFPELEEDRVVWLPYPVVPSAARAILSDSQDRPFVIGVAGRVVCQQKRADRWPEFIARCRAADLALRFEVLGDGPERGGLERRLASANNVRFHGRLDGEAYWRALSGWDAILFTSDYEGLPIALLEAMSAGVLPIFPRIGSGGDAYVERLDEALLYPAGDLAAAATIAQTLAGAPREKLALLRATARALIEPHLGDGYERTCAQFLLRIARSPRVSAAQTRPRPLLFTDFLPFAVLSRCCPQAGNPR